jgi:hypothetical protein
MGKASLDWKEEKGKMPKNNASCTPRDQEPRMSGPPGDHGQRWNHVRELITAKIKDHSSIYLAMVKIGHPPKLHINFGKLECGGSLLSSTGQLVT